MKHPIVYRDRMQVIAAGVNYADIRYGINRLGAAVEQQLILTQEEARELAGALAWVLTEVDAAHGYESFRPRRDRRLEPH